MPVRTELSEIMKQKARLKTFSVLSQARQLEVIAKALYLLTGHMGKTDLP